VPGVPDRFRKCAKLAAIPSAQGWTKKKAIQALGQLTAADIRKARCLLDFDEWATGTLDGIRGRAIQ
jgi:hypothetical protein